MSEARDRAAIGERVLVTTLTKRMAEDLCDYLNDHDIKVRYLHSDIDTVERVEILSDLRKGVFDVLVGINLLREGLDLPEVSLVAVLDADKEGFLRSTRSLIQTVGRAARNLNGRAILYADKVTDSMKRAIEETERRREKQRAHNEQHKITPRSVVKPVNDIIDGVAIDPNDRAAVRRSSTDSSLKTDPASSPMSAEEFKRTIQQLAEKMYAHARDLEFEQAAQLRDQITALKRGQFHPVIEAA